MDSVFICTRCSRAFRSQFTTRPSSRALSTAPRRKRTLDPGNVLQPSQQLPRWKQTPPAMKMPVRLRPQPRQPPFKVNDDPKVLDSMYDSFIGDAAEAAKGQEDVQSARGSELLPEEIKWLAITHKSFDQGRRGFNDRLAFLGKRIVDLQTSIALLNASATPVSQPSAKDVYRHPALDGVDNVTAFAKHSILDKARLARLATSYGLDKVVRWHPRKTQDLQMSGADTVMAHAVYGIIGALALQRGGEVAASVTRDRILRPLGLR